MIRKKKIQSNEGLGNRDRQDENTKSRVGFLPHYDKWHTIRFLFIFFFRTTHFELPGMAILKCEKG